jgi:hypothetical protein
VGELATINQYNTMADLDLGSVREMEARLTEIETRMKLVQDFFKRVLVKDVHYGVVPGAKKPTLYQPGADLLNKLYGFSLVILDKHETKDYVTGHYEVTARVRLVHTQTQINVGEGEGMASTREAKYRYRWVPERDIPRGLDKETLVYKEFEGKNGTYRLYRVENDDLYSLWNTVLKMAIKRAYVRATLAATGLSGVFSQEEDELEEWIEGTNPNLTQPTNADRKNGGGSANAKNRASEKQIKAIFATGRSKGLSNADIKNIVYQQTKKDLNDLNMDDASLLIDMLQKKTKDELLAMITGMITGQTPGDEVLPGSPGSPGLFGGDQA